MNDTLFHCAKFSIIPLGRETERLVDMRDKRLELLRVMPAFGEDAAVIMQTDAAVSEVMKLCADLISEYGKGELYPSESTFVVRKVRKHN